jgi:anionic cell wall polymer biosynthesis LytR-Cps2A-Psr (LCP) family protein
MGKEAYWYLRGRNKGKFDSATDRLRRQEQYISAFSTKLKSYTNGDVDKMVDIYNSIDDYIVTNIDFASLAEEISQYKYDSSRMYTIPGATKMGKIYEEYYIDEKKFYDLIIDIFYQEVVE